MSAAETNCYCGSGQSVATCCAPLLAGQRHAQTAEQLMRSRYSAFVTGAFDYLLATHHASARSASERAELEAQAQQLTWLALQVLDTAQGSASDDRGEVEFRAWFATGGRLRHLHERSRFVREQQRWFYVDAVFCHDRQVDIGRNDPCFCGSGRKYKHCHAR